LDFCYDSNWFLGFDVIKRRKFYSNTFTLTRWMEWCAISAKEEAEEEEFVWFGHTSV
jgi:hypothetical protein